MFTAIASACSTGCMRRIPLKVRKETSWKSYMDPADASSDRSLGHLTAAKPMHGRLTRRLPPVYSDYRRLPTTQTLGGYAVAYCKLYSIVERAQYAEAKHF